MRVPDSLQVRSLSGTLALCPVSLQIPQSLGLFALGFEGTVVVEDPAGMVEVVVLYLWLRTGEVMSLDSSGQNSLILL